MWNLARGFAFLISLFSLYFMHLTVFCLYINSIHTLHEVYILLYQITKMATDNSVSFATPFNVIHRPTQSQIISGLLKSIAYSGP